MNLRKQLMNGSLGGDPCISMHSCCLKRTDFSKGFTQMSVDTFVLVFFPPSGVLVYGQQAN